jgi:hypothetical protein
MIFRQTQSGFPPKHPRFWTLKLLLTCSALLLAMDRGVLAQEAAPRVGSSFSPYAAGLLARSRYTTDISGNRLVELWDLLVGPGKHSEATQLPGGAVLEVRAGSGRISIDGKTQDLKQGSIVAVPAGARIEIENAREDLGLMIRATIIRGGRA